MRSYNARVLVSPETIKRDDMVQAAYQALKLAAGCLEVKIHVSEIIAVLSLAGLVLDAHQVMGAFWSLNYHHNIRVYHANGWFADDPNFL